MSLSSLRRIAVITGAAGGIGRQISLRLAKEGFNIVASDLSSESDALKNLKEEIESDENFQGKALYHCADVSKESDVQDLVSRSVQEFGGLGVMIANAGVCHPNNFVDTSVEEWDRTFAINTRGIFLCYKAAAAHMIKQGKGGRIIGASSTVGKRGESHLAAYCASKFAVRGLTQSAASELFKYGITVNAYAPGGVNTAMLPRVTAERKAKGMGAHPVFNEEILKTLNIDLMEPKHLAGLISYLVKDEAKHITGQTICMNDGLFYD